jgi:DNA-binding MarR family transcriptional regulator
MTSKITKGDIKLLSHIAEYKLLTVKQLSAITQRTLQVVRRRLRNLENEHFIKRKERGFGSGRGRRENIIIMTQKGLELLRHKEILSAHAKYITDKSRESIFIDHDILINWVFIHLLQVARDNSHFVIRHFTTSSHDLKMGDADNPLIQEHLATDDTSENPLTMIPDGVFTISHQKKTILFFLEVDMGTETLASIQQEPGDVRQKIINYQSLFRSNSYKRYEKIFNAKIKGFRLLFLSNTFSRMKQLCNLTQQMPPSDFIWITDQKKMFSRGISAEIWARGGRYHAAPESILGPKLAFEARVINKIR